MIIKESIFINGNALTENMLFMDMKVILIDYKINFFKILALALEFFLYYKSVEFKSYFICF